MHPTVKSSLLKNFPNFPNLIKLINLSNFFKFQQFLQTCQIDQFEQIDKIEVNFHHFQFFHQKQSILALVQPSSLQNLSFTFGWVQTHRPNGLLISSRGKMKGLGFRVKVHSNFECYKNGFCSESAKNKKAPPRNTHSEVETSKL